ncbi:MAG: helix-turn-helix transcriptional regulator [Chloroflexi bacterium]|nr:MAG: helix-turn-helix transcriptional regulator [Chloroflexota bacterium]
MMVAGKEVELYEFIILAQLMYGPAHGYLIAKIINDMIGPYARLSYGRLYPLMAKMEQNGLIAAESKAPGGQKGDRQMRVYTITDAGRIRFHHLMSDTTSSPGDYQKLFTYKTCYFAFITPVERLRLIDHYINYCQAHVFHQQTEAEDLVRQVAEVEELAREAPQLAHGFPRLDANSVEYIVSTMQHTIDQWQLELDWAKRLREREVANAIRTGAEVASQQ